MTNVLTHPAVQDGWFREVSSEWPGQAMTLKVNKILHTEKSLYQDVLVFESESYGNVLVLDGVIQCTERDEFSYQEMIAHLPLASHPNPERVLVIGGGDGGVVREVLKHETVKEVVLCDIDATVVCVSKKFLPHMSTLLASPKVTIVIGDGFDFLATHEGTYDVIITDSSDPVGPAASLFELPYFKLLHNALTPGGHISTHGESIWLHLPLVQRLKNMMMNCFAKCEYAYTTVPTYTSGQIGLFVCAKAPDRDLKTPVREVKDTRYYNKALHASAFNLPEFARVLLEEDRDIRPVFGREQLKLQNRRQRKVLLLGSSQIARFCAGYIVRDPSNAVTIACRTLNSAESIATDLPNTTAISLDVSDAGALKAAVADVDLVVSLVPDIYHTAVIEAAIQGKTHVVTTSFISPSMRELDAKATEAGIVVMNEIGLTPGLDHLYAVKTISEVHAVGGVVKEFHSYSGGLPAPECADNPFEHKLSSSGVRALLALGNTASYYANGEKVTISGDELLGIANPYHISPAFSFVATPSGASTDLRERYGIPEAETVVQGTLLYQGFPELLAALIGLGWLDAQPKEWLVEGITWAQAMQKTIGSFSSGEAALVKKIAELVTFPSLAEKSRIISALKWIGLFSSDAIVPIHANNLLDILCARLETILAYAPGERDLVILQNKFIISYPDGRTETRTSTLKTYGAPTGYGPSAMARAVGLPCGIAAQMILDRKLTERGVWAPYRRGVSDMLRKELEKEGLGLVERCI